MKNEAKHLICGILAFFGGMFCVISLFEWFPSEVGSVFMGGILSGDPVRLFVWASMFSITVCAIKALREEK